MHDIYMIHLQSICYADYLEPNNTTLADFHCTKRSSYCESTKSHQGYLFLRLSTNCLLSEVRPVRPNRPGSQRKLTSQNTTIPFISEARYLFRGYNRLLHVAFIFYVLGVSTLGLGLFIGLLIGCTGIGKKLLSEPVTLADLFSVAVSPALFLYYRIALTRRVFLRLPRRGSSSLRLLSLRSRTRW